MDRDWEVAETQAELLDIEFSGYTIAVASRYLVVVGQMFIYLPDVLLGRIGVVNALLQFGVVAVVVEQDSLCGLPVASGAARFLEIGFDGVGAVVVQNQSYVGLVYTHSKGVSSHHDARAVVLPVALSLVFVGMVETGMIEGR